MREENLVAQLSLERLPVLEEMSPARRAATLRIVIATALGLALGAGAIMMTLNFPILYGLGFYAFVLAVPIALVVGNFRRLLLAIAILDVAFQFDAYIGWNMDSALLGSISGYGVGLTTAVVGLLYGMWFAEMLFLKRTPHHRPLVRTAGPLLLYMAAMVVSVTASVSFRVWSYEAFMLLQVFLLMIYIGGSLRNKTDVLFYLSVMLVLAAGEGLVTILQRFAGMFYYPGLDPIRPGGSFQSPNVNGAYLAVHSIIMLAIWIMPVKIRWKLAVLPLLMITMMALIVTQSRGAWICFALGTVILMYLSWRRGWLPTIVPIAGIVVGAIVGLVLFSIISERLTGNDGGAAEARGPLNDIALEMFQSQPLTGIGSNNFGSLLPYYIPPRYASEWLFTVHNKYLLVLSETGIIGFVGFVGFLMVSVLRGYRGWMKRDRFYSPLSLAFMASLLGHAFHLSWEVFNFRAPVQMLWMHGAFIFALTQIIEQGEQYQESGLTR
jgi:O-antigen ligase